MSYPQFWAEDAVVFYAEAERSGGSSLLASYAGYFHAAPRMLALAGHALPVPIFWLPAFYLSGALALTYVALCLISQAHSNARPVERWVASTVPLLVPFSQEILGVLTNVQWVLALTLIAAYSAIPPKSWSVRAAWGSVLTLAMLSGPFSLLLMPIAILALLVRRDAWSRWLAGSQALAACLTVKPLLSVRLPLAGETGANAGGDLIRALSDRPRMMLFLLGLGAALLVALIVGLRRRSLRLASPAGCGLLVLFATIVAGPKELLAAFPAGGGRYLYVPWVCLTWSLLSASSLPTKRALVLAALCAMLLTSVRFYRFAPSPRYDWRETSECLEREAFCQTTIVPGWQVGLPGRGPAATTPSP